MKENFFRSMTWLHKYVGLLVCWVLLLIFFAGTLSYYRDDINLWTKPELHKDVIQDYDADQVQTTLSKAQLYLNEHASDSSQWQVNFPTDSKPYLSYAWQLKSEPGQGRGRGQAPAPTEQAQQRGQGRGQAEQAQQRGQGRGQAEQAQAKAKAQGGGGGHRHFRFAEHIVQQDTVITEVRESRGGNFFYKLHFKLYYLPGMLGILVVGFCTMFMLVAIVSGVFIHRRIFKDFFSFRRNKASRAWLDAHNVSSVLALPYHLMITYTGLVTVMAFYMPWGVITALDGNTNEFRAQLQGKSEQVQPLGQKANLVSLDSLWPQIKEQVGETPIKQVVIHNPGDANSRVKVYRAIDKSITERNEPIIFDGVNGKLLSKTVVAESATLNVHDTFIALHTGRFAEPLLRLLFFISGLMGCAMITTGALLWAHKIRQKQQKQISQGQKATFGLRLGEGLNLMFIAGLPLATSVFFYANRLIPADMANRGQQEINCFFMTLLIVGIIACFKRTLTVWRALLTLTGLSLIAIPVLNALTSNSDLFSNINQAQWSLVGFDLMCVIFGLASLFAQRKVAIKQAKQMTGTHKEAQQQDVQAPVFAQQTSVTKGAE
ncbi:PepSY-associated TM helix domain-containing protein [Shewanella youngdeokensis]|uniref:PepSY-associated TM helix domain-containing protein n=1 Tax=Shewanella youngdeokensis TaxID=2999068 RepID=A0ABZ0JV51_9GAMM|nr:PepSY-associated TM helix domain-containing protein [Shewanella sp. DAU334]